MTGALLVGGGVAGYLGGKRFVSRWLAKEDAAAPAARQALAAGGAATAPIMVHPGRLPPPAPAPTSKPARLPRTFDPVFERYRGETPIEYLRALAMRESSMNPAERSGPAWGLLQIVEVVRHDYNRAHKASYQRADLLDPAVNVAMATWLLRLIIASYERNHPAVPNLRADWDNPRFVELLTFGWNAGFSQAGGVGKVVRHLEAQGTTDITIDRVHQHAKAAGASRHLSRADKVAWCKSVVALYQRERCASAPRPTVA
jgi:hypothetical protein